MSQYNRRASDREPSKKLDAGWSRAEVLAKESKALRARIENLKTELRQVKAKARTPPLPPPAKKATRAAGHQATAATLVLGFYAIQEEAGWPVASEQFLTSEPVNTGLMALMSVILGVLLGKKGTRVSCVLSCPCPCWWPSAWRLMLCSCGSCHRPTGT